MPRSGQKDAISSIISQVTSLGQFTVESSTRIATLWSNYGSIDRAYLRSDSSSDLKGTSPHSIIIKTVAPPSLQGGDQADEGHLRKLLSYEVERYFYSHLSSRLPKQAKVAHFHPAQSPSEGDGTRPVQIILEDLSIEYPNPARGSLDLEDTKAVLTWLATFHGTFWGVNHEQGQGIQSTLIPPPLQYNGGNKAGVWEQGTYWYLDTRREELGGTDGRQYGWLLKWVEKVDMAIKSEAGHYGTLLHGDVKGANIVFSSTLVEDNQSRCALYDFQYTGLGLVTRDLVYFLGTTTQSRLLRDVEQEKELLRTYHGDLMQYMGSRRERLDGVADDENDPEYSFSKLWGHWELALVDWCRFMAGWGFWGNGSWVERRTKEIVSEWDNTGFPYSDH